MAMALPGRWALAGLTAGPERARVEPSGSTQTERIGFLFSEIILNAKTIPENLEIILKA
jgi:hypothetical protein